MDKYEQKSKKPAATLGKFNYVFICKSTGGLTREVTVTAENDHEAETLAEFEFSNDVAPSFNSLNNHGDFAVLSNGTTIIAYAETDENHFYIYPQLEDGSFFKVKKDGVNRFKKHSYINHGNQILPLFMIDLKSVAIIEKIETGIVSDFEKELNDASVRFLSVQLINITFQANGEGTITFNGNSYPCLGNPTINYPKDLTVNTKDKYRKKFSQEYQVTMEFAILIWGQRGIYIHYDDDSIATNGGVSAGCIHVEEPQIETLFNWITGPTRVTISYPW